MISTKNQKDTILFRIERILFPINPITNLHAALLDITNRHLKLWLRAQQLRDQ